MAVKPVTPRFVAPKFNADALIALQKSNIETLVQAQTILIDAAQAISKVQYGWVAESLKAFEGAFEGNVTARKPEELMADAKAAAEKVVKVAKEEIDLGMKAQNEVVDLVTKRVAANLEEVKALAS
ncbi:MAG: phasin family protein [Geminicoccaceae bacterium]|nr:phasin family protein [Geminicoccaceae bacterium]MCB9944104.1 phasin family protein [Geminicoccaceae bacterium]